ncbi:sodium potassium-transporting ATPase subunit beta-1-like [Paramuricea clavata]|uniref:Sodium potassium-transporting ATPase subunit beta-1-like n=1 Tax=Paramuricea clavata TaxID=317549 RepID=A0A7D9JX31_PARCT|nr:sodium potassium-transporting ATPase subunit beta-1-like [Paramuricea clavata]
MEEKEHPTRTEQLTIMYTSFRIFLYNEEKGEVMGRTAESWGKIGLFFLVYYACLAAFFAAIFAIAFSTMPEIEDGPKYTSFISDKPLLLVYPENGIGSWKREDIDRSIKTKYENFLDGRYNFTPLFIVKKNCSSGHKIMVDQ